MYRHLLAALAIAATVAACGSTNSTPSATPTAPSTGSNILSLTSGSRLTIAVGDSRQLKAVALLADGTTQIFTTDASWSSSDPNIATVDAAGIVTGIAAGSATISITVGSVTQTVALTVTAASADPQTFAGVAAGGGALSGSLAISVLSNSVASGTLTIGFNSVALGGRFDAAASVINIQGGAYSLLGTLRNGGVAGSVLDPSGHVVGGFSAIDSTHVAVTTLCGTYTAGDGTSGAWNAAVSTSGAASASSMQSDSGRGPIVFVGHADGGALSLSSADGRTATGSIATGAATGTFQIAPGVTGAFTARSNACR